MEQNGSDNIASQLCRMGCGFFGNQQFEGMCSKCFKDHMKRKQNQSQSATSFSSGRDSPASCTSTVCSTSSSSSAKPAELTTSTAATTMPTTTPSVDTATPTVPSILPNSAKDKHPCEEGATGGAEAKSPVKSASDLDSSSDERDGKKPKKNRCTSCKKKVGLTGFPCRCGSLFCSLHRYSDKHDCPFNYKELAQEEIRKNNPVVVGQKIMKI